MITKNFKKQYFQKILSICLFIFVAFFSFGSLDAEAATRVRTLEFFGGQDAGSATPDNSATAQNFPQQNVQIAESSVDVIDAYVELTLEHGANAATTSTEALIYFDSCAPTACAPSTAIIYNSAGLGTNSGEAQTLRFRADVSGEATLAAFTGGTFAFQIGYCIDGATGSDAGTCNGTAAASIQGANAKLVVTYTYDDTSATQTNTVIYPLESNTTGPVGSKTAVQAACTMDSNCPTLNYNANIPEISSQVSQFFNVQFSGGSVATTTDHQFIPQVNGNASGSTIYFEQALSVNGGWMNYLVSGLSGYANNSAQALETGVKGNAYVLGGENYVTYTYANNAATKTKTIVMPVGEVQTTGSTTKSSLVGSTVYFPEGGVNVEKAWFRVHTTAGGNTTPVNLDLTTKVGGNAESGISSYSFTATSQGVSDDGFFIHMIPSADYTELEAATIDSGKLVQMTADWATARGAVSAELVITYTYTAETNGFNQTQLLFGGQSTAAAATTFSASNGEVDPYIYISTGVKTILGVSLLMNGKDTGALANQTTGSTMTVSPNACTASNTSTTYTDTEITRIALFKSITGVVTNDNSTTYTPCYSSSEASIFNGRVAITVMVDTRVVTLSGSTNLADASNVIKVAVDGVVDSAAGSIASGSWSIVPATLPTSGQVVVVFVDGQTDANESTAVSKYDGTGTTMSGMVLNAKTLTIGSEDNQSLTLTNLDTYDCVSDEDVVYSVTSSVLNIEGQGCAGGANSYTDETASILASNTLTIGSTETLTTEKIINAGTLTSTTTATYNITGTSGTLFTNTGTFTEATSTMNVTSASGTPTLLSAAETFHILNINSAATVINAGATITIADASGSKLYIQSGVLNDSGNGISTSGSTNNTFEIGATGTVCLGGASGANTSATCDTSAASTTARAMPSFATYTFNATSTVVYMSDAETTISTTPAYGNVILSPLLITTSRSYNIIGTFTVNSNLTLSPNESDVGTPTLTVNALGNINVTSLTRVTRSNGALAVLDLRPAATSYDLYTGSLRIDTGGTLDASGATSTIRLTNGSGSLFTIDGGTFNEGTSTVDMTGNGDATVNSGSPTFYNLTSSGTGVKTLGAGIVIATGGTLTVSAGTFDPTTFLVAGSGTNTLAVSSGATIRVGASTFAGNYSAGFGTLTLNANSTTNYNLAGIQTISGTPGYGHLTISGSGTKTLGGATAVAGNLIVSAGTLQLADQDITVTGTTSINGTIDDNNTTGTNIFTGAVTVNNGGTWTSTGNDSYTMRGGLTVNSTSTFTSGNGTYTFDTNAQTIDGTQTYTITNIQNNITSSTGLTFSGTTASVTTLVQGTNAVLTFSGTVPTITTLTATASPNTVQYTGGTQTVKGTTYHHLTASAAGAKTLGAATIVNGDVTVSAGALDTGNYDLTAGAIAVSGSATVTLGSSTVTLTSTGTVWNYTSSGAVTANTSTIKFTNNSASLKTFAGGGSTYNNLWLAPSTGTGTFEITGSNTFAEFKDDGTAAHSILFTTGTTQTITTWTVSGNAGQLITINSGDGAGGTSTSTHTLSKSSGTVSSDYLNIQHSIAQGGADWFAGANSTNNNSVSTAGSGWVFTIPTYTITISGDATTCTGAPNYVTSGSSCVVQNTSIETNLNAGTNVSLTAGSVVVSSSVTKSSGGSVALSIYADANITISAAVSSSFGTLGILLNSDRDANTSGYINIAGALTSNGGNITIGGGSGTISAGTGFAIGNSGQAIGVLVNGVTVAAGGGNIIINGQGYNTTTDNNHGVRVTGASGAITTTGTGTIDIKGTGAGSSNSASNYGLYVDTGGVISTINGNLTIANSTGGGSGSGANNYGVYITGTSSTVKTTGIGNLSVTATGGNASGSGGSNIGIRCSVVDCLQTTGGGTVSINTTGGNGSGSGSANYGMWLQSSSSITGSGGTITINSTAGASSANTNIGIFSAGTISNTGSGSINITANGAGSSNSANDHGLSVFGGIISTVNGNLTINATASGAGTGTDNYGVYVSSTNGTIKTTGSGDISITATGGNTSGSGANNYGVYCAVVACIQTTDAGGDISITATGGNGSGSGASNYGLYVTGSIAGGGGTMVVSGTGGNSSGNSNTGVLVSGASSFISNSGTGTLSVTGNGAGSSNNASSYGISLESAATIATINGDLTIVGDGGGAGAGTNNYGVYVIGVNTTIKTTGSGSIILTGIRGGGDTATNYGVNIAVANGIQTTSSGNITINTDTINLAESNDINSVGNLTIRPYTASTTVGVGAGTGTLALTDAKLGYIAYGSSSTLTIGSTSAGDISINSSSTAADKNLTFLSGSNISLATTALTHTGASAATLTMKAYGNITLSSAISANTSALNILLQSDFDASTSGYINITGAITSNGGNITIGGGSGTISAGTGFAVGQSSGQGIGVYINNVAISAGGGNIIINGQGYNDTTTGSTSYHGVDVAGASASVKTTGSGTIHITGYGKGTTSYNNYGVRVLTTGSEISTVNGDLYVTGYGGSTTSTGGGTNSYGIGVQTNGGVIKTTGSGDIYVSGTAGNLTGSGQANIGVYINTVNGVQTTGTGDISITGIGGGNSSSNHNRGIFINVGFSVSAAGGNITLNGTGGGGTSGSNPGIRLTTASVTNTGVGSISVTATGGTNSYGIHTDGTTPTISTVDGDLTITSTGSSGSVSLGSGSVIKTTGTGDIIMNAVSGLTLAIANGLQTTVSGDIIVNTNSISLNQSNNINSIGNLTIRPYTESMAIGVGAGGGTLLLSDTSLGYLTWGTSSTLTIGSTNSGNITINSGSTILNKNVTFLTGGNISLATTALTHTGASAATLNMYAYGNITTTSAITANTSALTINLHSDYDANSSGTISIGSGVGSNGGVITILGGGGTLNTTSTYDNLTVNISGANTLTQSAALNVTGGITLSGGTLATANNDVNASSVFLSGGNLTPGSSILTLSGTGTVFSRTSGTYTAGTSTIKFTDTSSSLKTFAGGGSTYNNLWLAPSTGTGTFEITGSNTFAEFKDDGTAAHSILFTTGTTQTITTWTVSGNAGQLITINSGDGAGGTSTSTHTLAKTNNNAVDSDYLNIQHSVATPYGYWFAGEHSTDNNSIATAGSGWFFNRNSTYRSGGSGNVESSATPDPGQGGGGAGGGGCTESCGGGGEGQGGGGAGGGGGDIGFFDYLKLNLLASAGSNDLSALIPHLIGFLLAGIVVVRSRVS